MASRITSDSRADRGSCGPAALEHQYQHEHQRQQSNMARTRVALAAVSRARLAMVFVLVLVAAAAAAAALRPVPSSILTFHLILNRAGIVSTAPGVSAPPLLVRWKNNHSISMFFDS